MMRVCSLFSCFAEKEKKSDDSVLVKFEPIGFLCTLCHYIIISLPIPIMMHLTNHLTLTFIIMVCSTLRSVGNSSNAKDKHLRQHHRTTFSFKEHSKEQPRNLIVGGTEVTEGSYPYLAYLDVIGAEGDQYFCGGTLIAADWILTSAQCILNATEITVILGAHDITNACSQGGPVECHSVNIKENVHVFPEYDPKYLEADFAMLKLAIDSDKATAAINMKYTLPKVKDKVWIAGRGATADGEYSSVVPMETAAEVVSHDECEGAYGSSITPDLQCAKGQGMYDTCYGDSGGPIIVKLSDIGSGSDYVDTDERDLLVGVVSWGGSPRCPSSSLPALYSRVASALSWIITTATENAVVQSGWTCYDLTCDHGDPCTTPVSLSDKGQVQCFSFNGKDCDFHCCKNGGISNCNTADGVPLECGPMHAHVWGGSGYLASHWCNSACIELFQGEPDQNNCNPKKKTPVKHPCQFFK
jgi:hypothetical protein